MKNNKLYCLVLIMAAVMVLSGCSKDPATPQNTLATPEETVKAYCDLDAKGARLTSATWSKVLPYISWSEEAGFDRAVVISGFSIGKVQKKGDAESAVTVEYQVLGAVSGDYVSGKKTESVRFKVVKTGRGWKISEPDFMPPHVLAKEMAKHLEGTKKNEAAEKVKSEEK
ncbi:MAG: hypothetical protein AABZ15_08665 [Nitrospirota bacterium]